MPKITFIQSVTHAVGKLVGLESDSETEDRDHSISASQMHQAIATNANAVHVLLTGTTAEERMELLRQKPYFGEYPLVQAAAKGCMESIDYLLEGMSSRQLKSALDNDSTGVRAIVNAHKKDHVGVVMQLLRYGVKPPSRLAQEFSDAGLVPSPKPKAVDTTKNLKKLQAKLDSLEKKLEKIKQPQVQKETAPSKLHTSSKVKRAHPDADVITTKTKKARI